METKHWYQSKTIIGALITALASVVQMFGYAIPAALQVEIVNAVILLATAGGAVLAIVGRIRAETKIGPAKGGSGPTGAALAIGLAVFLSPMVTACASFAAQTPAQTVYAIQSDYAAAQAAAVTYIQSDQTNPRVVKAIQTADATAWDALQAAQIAVREGSDPAAPALIETARHAVQMLAELVLDPIPPPAD